MKVFLRTDQSQALLFPKGHMNLMLFDIIPVHFSLITVLRRLFFAAQQRIAVTLSPNYYKKIQRFNEKESRRTWPSCHVSLEKSSKNYSHWEIEPNQTSCKHPPSPTRQVKWRVFLAGFQRGDPEPAEFTRRCVPPFWIATFRGEGGVICGLI
jgi:hypothetical protein